MNGLRKFGLGILWAIFSPVLLVGIALVGVFGLVNFFVEFVIMVINFFKGKKLFPMFPEDELAYKRIQEAMGMADEEENHPAQPEAQPQPQQVFVQQNFYTQPGMPQQPYGIPPQQQPYMQVPNPQMPQNPYGIPPQPMPGQPQVPPLMQIPPVEQPRQNDTVIPQEEDEQ